MTQIENIVGWIRHRSGLRKAAWLWHAIRPLHDGCWRVLARNGISRVINGTDQMQISPRLRRLSDEYEPEVWRNLMGEVKAGDTFVDIGSFHGLYAVAVGKRAGQTGRVYAFEPDQVNFSFLKEHISLNHLEDIATIENKAVSSKTGLVFFNSGRGLESGIDSTATSGFTVSA